MSFPSSHYISVFNAVMELKEQGLSPDMKTLGSYLLESRGLRLVDAEIVGYVADFITRGFRVLDASASVRNYFQVRGDWGFKDGTFCDT